MEQYRVNLGSLRQEPAPPVWPPLREAWRWVSDRRRADFFGVGATGVVVGAHDEEPTPDWFEEVRYQAVRLDAATGVEQARLPGRRLLGVCGETLVCQEESAQLDRLVGHGPDGGERWRVTLADAWRPRGYAAPDGFYAWMTEPGRLWFVDRDGAARELPRPGGQVSWLRAAARLCALRTFDRPGDRSEIIERATGRVVWAEEPDTWEDEDLLVDDAGWLRRAPSRLGCHAPDGAPLWQAPGAARAWLSGAWVLAAGPGLRLLRRDTGAAVEVTLEPERLCDAALGQGLAWLLLGNRELWAVDTAGRVVARETPPLPLARILAHGGRLFGQTDEGSVIAFAGGAALG